MEAPITPICKCLLTVAALGIAPFPATATATAVVAATTGAATGGELSDYLAARNAAADGAVGPASASFARALADDPNAVVAIRAYREALLAGDIALARKAAALLTADGVAPADAALLPLAEAGRNGDGKAADAALVTLGEGPLKVLVPALRGWIAYSRGQNWAVPLDAAGKDSITRRFAEETRALLLIAAGKREAGMAIITAMGGVDAPLDLRVAAAQLLAKDDLAAAARLLPGVDPATVALRSTPAKPTLAFGISRLLARVAADLPGNDPSPLPVSFVRASLIAAPDNDRARLLLADLLARRNATAAALSLIDGFAPASPFASAAASLRITVLDQAGRKDEALAAARTRATGDASRPTDWQRYADLLVDADRYAEAAAQYARVIQTPAGAGDWTAWLQYGGALERADRWAEARPALERAVTLAPDEPLALNYLGYSRVERGEQVAASTAMLEKANALKPGDPSITDSLGWAYHLTGDTRRALPLLERAAAADPVNAEISDHLGDVYWSLGRRYEARYAWRAAAVTADTKELADLDAKIVNGPAGRSASRAE